MSHVKFDLLALSLDWDTDFPCYVHIFDDCMICIDLASGVYSAAASRPIVANVMYGIICIISHGVWYNMHMGTTKLGYHQNLK